MGTIYTLLDRKKCAFLRQPNRIGTFTLRELRENGVWNASITDTEAAVLLAVLLAMMLECKICFEWDTKDPRATIYLAPDLLPESRREVETNLIAKVDDEYATAHDSGPIHYDLLHDGILRGLMSKVGGEAGNEAFYWRSGFFSGLRSGKAWVLVEAKRPNTGASGSIRVKVYSNDDSDAAATDLWNRMKVILLQQKPNPSDAQRLGAGRHKVGPPSDPGDGKSD